MSASDKVEIRYSTIYNSKVKADIKIASISDIHMSDAIRNEEIDSIVRIIKEEKPDYICVLGDTIDSTHIINENNKSKCKRLFTKLSKISKVYIILGNHDFINYGNENKYREENNNLWEEINSINNVYLLNDEIKYNKDITIVGYKEKYNYYHGEKKNYFYDDFLDLKLNSINSKNPVLLIMHSPGPLNEKINQKLVSDYDIILCGHFHNGCVPALLNRIWLPKHSGIVAPSRKFFPRNVRGIKKLGNKTYLIYNGGWTKIANNAPKYLHPFDKLCNRQIDITILTNNEKCKEIEVHSKKKNINGKFDI